MAEVVKGFLLCLDAITENYSHISEITAKSCTTYKKCRQLGQKFDIVTRVCVFRVIFNGIKKLLRIILSLYKQHLFL